MRRCLAVFLAAALIGCAAPPKVPGLTERYAGDAVADAALRDRVLAASYAYWAALGDGRWEEAFGFFTLDYQEKVPFGAWLRQSAEPMVDRPRPVSILWSKAAHRHHGPELYAFLRWVSPGPSPVVTGALIWRQQPDGGFLLESTEADPLPPVPKT